MLYEVGTHLFSVTDQNIILRLVITATTTDAKFPGIVTLKTDLVGPHRHSGHAEAHHKCYYSRLYIYKGNIQHGCVFLDWEEARKYAHASQVKAIADLKRDLVNAEARLRSLEPRNIGRDNGA